MIMLTSVINRFLLFVFVLIQISTNAFSQVSPVQVLPSVLPPYSTLLSEYYTGDNTRLSVTLINTDFNEPQLKVYLRMTIEGQGVKLQSSDYGNYPSIELTPGLPVTLRQTDLAPYFSSQNLIVAASSGGLRPQVRLPEGYYQFSFEAIEVTTKRVVGNKQSAQAYLTLSDPPFLTMPESGSSVPYANPFNLLFQWTPRHLSNPNAYNTEYQFDLVEIWDDGLAPQAAFYTSKPIYSTKLNTTNLFYGPGEPQLVVGKRYAWRIQATLVTDNNEQAPFRNDGYSEIFWFKLQGDCPLLQKADIVSDPHNNKTKLSWISELSSVGSYKIDYRKKGVSAWTTVDAPSNMSTLTGLSWNTDYEYKLGNRCVITDEYAYGGIQSFRTLNQDTTKCVPSAPKVISNTTGIARLIPGDTIYASGFRMRLTRVTGSNGQFSGEGYLGLLIPTTTTEVSVKASFQNISVNTDKELFAGKIVSIYDRKEGGIGNIDKIFEGGQGVGSTITGATAAIAVNAIVDPSKKAIITTTASSNGETTYEVTVTGTDGKSVTFQAKKLPVVIQDKSGKIYTVDKDGNIQHAGSSGATQQQILAGKGAEELNLLNTDKGTVTFEALTDQTYALDVYVPAYNKSALFSQKYESLVQGKYRVANKLLVTGSTDKIRATISDLGTGIHADSIHFVTAKGVELSAVKVAENVYDITVLSGPENDAQELYAVYRDRKAAEENTDPKINTSSFTYSFGKLNIATYAAKQLKVTLVPVGTATIDEFQVQQKLNEIYNPVGISWSVSKATPFTDVSWDTNKDGRLDVKYAGKNNKYSAEMQALNSAYASTGINAATPYLFVFNTVPLNATETIQGDMLRNHQFGYLFAPLTDAGTVAAHELAHGIFHLNHIFDTQYNFKEGDLADNLMDYRTGGNLVKLQWDAIHAPGLVIGVFEKEGDGASLNFPYYNFTDPSGKLFSIQSNEIKLLVVVKRGAILSFYYSPSTGGSFTAEYQALFEDESFIGYFNKDGNSFPQQEELPVKTVLINSFLPGTLNGNCMAEYCTTSSIGGTEDCNKTVNTYLYFNSNQIEEINDFVIGTNTFHVFRTKEYKEIEINDPALKAFAKMSSKVDVSQSSSYVKGNKKYEIKNGKISVTTLTAAEITALKTKIEAGDWEDESITSQILYESSSNGTLQVAAVGFQKNLTPPGDHIYNRIKVQSETKNKVNAYLTKKAVKALDQVSVSEHSNMFPDGKNVEIQSENYFVIASAVLSDLAYTIKNGAITPLVYNDQLAQNKYQEHPFHIPPILTGAANVGLVQYRDITDMLSLVRDVTIDEVERAKIIDGFSKLATEVSNDPSKLIGLLRDAAIDESTAGADISNLGFSNNLQIHNTTQASVGGVIMALTAASKIDDIIDNIRKKALLAGKLNLPNLKNVSDVLTGLTASNKKNLLNLLKDADDDLLQQVNDELVKNPKLFDADVPADLDGLKKLATGTEAITGIARFTKYTLLINKLDELDKITPGSKQKFLEDFASATDDVIDNIGKNPNLVNSWKVLFHTNIPSSIRTNTAYLATVNKQMANYGDQVAFKFEKVLPKIKTDDYDDFFKALNNPNSIDHVRSLVGDFEKIPGISLSKYTPNGLPKLTIEPPRTWANPLLDLPANHAPNFTQATAKTLSPGQKIYRVIGDVQNPAGGYWTYELPMSKADVFGGTAVRPEWNNPTKYVEYTVPEGGLKVWDGPAASQRLLDGIDDVSLSGGAFQIYVPEPYRQIGNAFDNLITINLKF